MSMDWLTRWHLSLVARVIIVFMVTPSMQGLSFATPIIILIFSFNTVCVFGVRLCVAMDPCPMCRESYKQYSSPLLLCCYAGCLPACSRLPTTYNVHCMLLVDSMKQGGGHRVRKQCQWPWWPFYNHPRLVELREGWDHLNRMGLRPASDPIY